MEIEIGQRWEHHATREVVTVQGIEGDIVTVTFVSGAATTIHEHTLQREYKLVVPPSPPGKRRKL